jgi:hypothetical protein
MWGFALGVRLTVVSGERLGDSREIETRTGGLPGSIVGHRRRRARPSLGVIRADHPSLAAATPGGEGKFVARAGSCLAHAHLGPELVGVKKLKVRHRRALSFAEQLGRCIAGFFWPVRDFGRALRAEQCGTSKEDQFADVTRIGHGEAKDGVVEEKRCSKSCCNRTKHRHYTTIEYGYNGRRQKVKEDRMLVGKGIIVFEIKKNCRYRGYDRKGR